MYAIRSYYGRKHSRPLARMANLAGAQQGGGLGGGAGGGPFLTDHGSDPFQVPQSVLQGKHQPMVRQNGLGGVRGGFRDTCLGEDQDQIGVALVLVVAGERRDGGRGGVPGQVGEQDSCPVDGLGA